MTQVVGEASSTSLEAQSVIAVFDDWEGLQPFLRSSRGGTTALFSPARTGPPGQQAFDS